jgi:hypothetical protein
VDLVNVVNGQGNGLVLGIDDNDLACAKVRDVQAMAGRIEALVVEPRAIARQRHVGDECESQRSWRSRLAARRVSTARGKQQSQAHKQHDASAHTTPFSWFL